MKTLLLAALISTSTFASDVKIKSFSVIRAGGGSLEAVVAFAADGKIEAYTKSCNFRELSSEDQVKTLFTLSKEESDEAEVILNNRAIIASKEMALGLPRPTGTWSLLGLTYEYKNFDGKVIVAKKDINRPVIVIDGKLSNVLRNIEDQAREVNAQVCD